jgi:hypothetical protein
LTHRDSDKIGDRIEKEEGFVTDVALTLFAVSLGFSIEFAYRDLQVFPTKFLYHLTSTSPCDRVCGASVVFDALNVGLLVLLGCFWYYRGELRSWLQRRRFLGGGLPLLIAYFFVGAFVGISPWLVYIVMHIMLLGVAASP